MAGSYPAKRVAQEHAPYCLVYDLRDQQQGWYADCLCGRSQRVNLPVTNPPKVTISRYELLGWLIKKNHAPVCPTCQKAAMMKPATQIGPDPKIARKIFACLDEHFDDQTRTYRNDWTDEKVAKSLDVSLEIVTNIRKSAYGELAENQLFGKLKDDIDLLKMELEDALEIQREDMEGAFEITRKTFLARFNALDAELARLRKPVAKAAG